MSNEELKATIQDIHDNVYKQGKADGRAEVIEEIKDSIHEIYKCQFYCMDDLCEKERPTVDMCIDCFYDSIQKVLERKIKATPKDN